MKDYLDEVDIKARKFMGFEDRKTWTYEEAVDNYIAILNYYANETPIEFLCNYENLDALNIAFNYCTGEVLVEFDEGLSEPKNIANKIKTNKHYKDLLTVGNLILDRFNNEDLSFIGNNIATSIYMMAEIIYSYETNNSKDKTKIYS